MTDTLYHAPARDDNIAGPREFAYMAEVDILGWKFRLMKDGKFIIDTPGISATMPPGSHLLTVLGRDHAALIAALLALDPEVPDALIPSHWRDVGRLVT